MEVFLFSLITVTNSLLSKSKTIYTEMKLELVFYSQTYPFEFEHKAVEIIREKVFVV